MTTLPFTRKNNLLSLLRGYDLPIKRNYLNAALLGYGKRNKKDETKDEKKENRYQDFRSTAAESLNRCIDAIEERIDDDKFWHGSDIYKALRIFTRFYIARLCESSSEFFINIERFLVDIADSKRYFYLLETMDALADELKAISTVEPTVEELLPTVETEEQVKEDIPLVEADEYTGEGNPTDETDELTEEKIWGKYERIKEESKEHILNFTPVTNREVINFILDCIVYSTEVPEQFESHWEKYKMEVITTSDTDLNKIFSEDLVDTMNADENEDEGEYDSEDEKFVVPDADEYIEYKERPAKRRKLVPSKEDEEEVTGSGFYDWWW